MRYTVFFFLRDRDVGGDYSPPFFFFFKREKILLYNFRFQEMIILQHVITDQPHMVFVLDLVMNELYHNGTSGRVNKQNCATKLLGCLTLVKRVH